MTTSEKLAFNMGYRYELAAKDCRDLEAAELLVYKAIEWYDLCDTLKSEGRKWKGVMRMIIILNAPAREQNVNSQTSVRTERKGV